MTEWINVETKLPDSNRCVMYLFQRLGKTYIAMGRFERSQGWFMNKYQDCIQLENDKRVRFWSEINLPEDEGL